MLLAPRRVNNRQSPIMIGKKVQFHRRPALARRRCRCLPLPPIRMKGREVLETAFHITVEPILQIHRFGNTAQLVQTHLKPHSALFLTDSTLAKHKFSAKYHDLRPSYMERYLRDIPTTPHKLGTKIPLTIPVPIINMDLVPATNDPGIPDPIINRPPVASHKNDLDRTRPHHEHWPRGQLAVVSKQRQ